MCKKHPQSIKNNFLVKMERAEEIHKVNSATSKELSSSNRYALHKMATNYPVSQTKSHKNRHHAKQKRRTTTTLRSKSHMEQVQGGKVNAPSPSPPLLCCLVMCGMNRWNVCNCSDGGTLGSAAHPGRQIES